MTWQTKVVGRNEDELFEALKHSDRVLDEELEGGGWKGNMDKSEVVPTMKGKRPGFDLAGKGQGIVAGARHLGGRFTWNGRSCSAERERHALRGFQWADSGR